MVPDLHEPKFYLFVLRFCAIRMYFIFWVFAITKRLEPPRIAFEKDQELIDIGNKMVPQAEWLQFDLTD